MNASKSAFGWSALIIAMHCITVAGAVAQSPPATDSSRVNQPPIQQIATASSLSTEKLGSVMDVRELPDGRVIVNDGVRRRLMLMDSTLKLVSVLLDSAGSNKNFYGAGQPGSLIPYRGDTTLFIDPSSYAVLMFDEQAKLARIRAVWNPRDVYMVTGTSFPYGWIGTDAKGRIIYRANATPAPAPKVIPDGVIWVPQNPDSTFVIAVDLETRKRDTIGVVRIPKSRYNVRKMPEGYYSYDNVTNPLPLTDQWAVLSDGTVAFIRGIDYRVEYLNPDGTHTSSAKLPYEWVRLADEDKKRTADSVRTVMLRSSMTSYTTNMIRWVNLYRRSYPVNFKAPDGFIVPPGLPNDWKLPPGVTLPANYTPACPPGVEPTMSAAAPAAAAPGAPPVPGSTAQGGVPPGTPSCIPVPFQFGGMGQSPPPPVMRPVVVMEAEELPDYRPPFTTASARPDRDGNIWIRTVQPRPIPGGTVFDVISRQGELTARYQIPSGYTIVGFGKNKIVYLSMRDAQGIHVARVQLR